MPKCLRCGNHNDFGVMEIPSTAPTANGPVSGLMGHFSNSGELENMESMGASVDEVQDAFEHPERYFDVCLACGSEEVVWD